MAPSDGAATPGSGTPAGDGAGPAHRSAFFGSFPTRGLWTPLGLRRGQFLAVLGFSLALFVFVGGPVWTHEHASHFVRIAVSYAAIPIGVALAFARNGDRRLLVGLAASAVIGIIKLLLTALLLMAVALAG